jgi:hypothetical protein
MTFKTNKFEQWKPGVPRGLLPLLAALTWIASAVILNIFAYTWLRQAALMEALLAAGAGFLVALLIHHFGFLRIVDKNLGRIRAMDGGRRCAFAFMPWKSYLLIPFMILLGFVLRHSPLPRLYLAVIYTAIVMALLLSSIRYLRHAWQGWKRRGSEKGDLC